LYLPALGTNVCVGDRCGASGDTKIHRTQNYLLLNLSVSPTYPSQIIRRFAMGWRDDWPSMPDGKPYDGMNLLQLTLDGKSPFGGVWDVRLLLQEIEENLSTRVADIPFIDKGSNNYVRLSSDYIPSPLMQIIYLLTHA